MLVAAGEPGEEVAGMTYQNIILEHADVGIYVLTVTAIDGAGNTNAPVTLSVTVQ